MAWFSIIPIIGSLLDKLLPDSDARNKAKAELAILHAKGDLDTMLKQMEINLEEGKHASIFVAGWRPFIGWVCGVAFGYHFLLQPTIVFIAAAMGNPIDLPVFDMTSLLTVLLGMLGLGGMRTFEKLKGVAK